MLAKTLGSLEKTMLAQLILAKKLNSDERLCLLELGLRI